MDRDRLYGFEGKCYFVYNLFTLWLNRVEKVSRKLFPFVVYILLGAACVFIY